jgi:hypothetical protein
MVKQKTSSTLEELKDDSGSRLDNESIKELTNELKEFDQWLISIDVKKTPFDISQIGFAPFSNADWIMKVEWKGEKGKVDFNPFIAKDNLQFFKVVLLHEYFHLVVQKVPNKDDATMIKDSFGNDFMSLIDIEADFYVAAFLKSKGCTLREYWKLSFEGSRVFSDRWIRNKKFERFIGSMLTINFLFSDRSSNFDLFLPTVSTIFTEGKMRVLIVKSKHILFEEIKMEYEDFVEIRGVYKDSIDLTFEGYIKKVIGFTNKALNLKLDYKESETSEKKIRRVSKPKHSKKQTKN